MKTSRVENFKPGRVCFLPSVPIKNYYVCDVRGMQEGRKKGREKIKKMARGSTIVVFLLIEGDTLDRNFLPFGRVRGEICQNWINGR